MLALANKLTISTQPIYRFVNKYSIDFDGVDDRIVTDGADTVAQNSTYSFWCKSSTASRNVVFGHGALTIGAFSLNYDGNRPIIRTGDSKFLYFTDVTQQDDGEWHHWVVYMDYVDLTNSKLYCDGVLQNVDQTSNTGTINAYTESITIGADNQAGSNTFEGKIDEFAVYDRELTQAEITRMYNTYYSPNRVANGNFSQIGNEEVTNGNFSQEGSEEITNGDFATDLSGWSISGNSDADHTVTWTSQGARYQSTTTSPTLLFFQNSLTSGKTYKFTVDIAYTSGTIKLQTGSGASLFNPTLVEGTNTFYFTASSVQFLFIRSTTNVDVLIDNVSVKEVGQDWTFGTNWSMTDGKATATLVSNTYLQQSGILTSGKTYKITYTVSDYVQGKVRFRNSGVNGTSNTGNGTFTDFITAAGSNFSLQGLSDGGGFTGSVDNITVKEVGQHWTFGTGWSTDGTKALFTTDGSASSAKLEQVTSFNNGATYKVLFDLIDTNSAGVYVRLAGGSWSSSIAGTGSKELSLVAGSGNDIDIEINDGTKSLSIDNIVVQELKHDATNLMLNAGAYQSANPLITSTKSMEFDGSDDYLTVSDDSILDFSNAKLTFAAWVYPETSGYGTVIGKSGQYVWYAGTAGSVKQRFFIVGTNGNLSVNSNTFLEQNKWSFICVTFDGSNAKLYLNGIDDGGGALVNDISSGANPVQFGRQDTGEYWNGNITEVGMYDRVLTALEVASLYNQGMPTNLLVNRNNYQSGNPTVFNTKQVDFDGTDDYLKVENAYGNFTGSLSFWYKRDDINGVQYLFDSRGDGGSGIGYALFNSSATLSISGGTRYVNGIAGNISMAAEEWHHVVLSGIPLNINEDIKFGTRYNVSSNLDGKMSQVGLWNSTLTADEVSSLYNHGLPIDLKTDQAAYASSSNLVGYWRMGSGTLDTYPLIADQTNATLGSELVTNGDFSDGSTGWTLGGSWEVNNGEASTTGDGTNQNLKTTSTLSTVAGRTYEVSFLTSNSTIPNPQLRLYDNGITNPSNVYNDNDGVSFYVNGQHTYTFTATASSKQLILRLNPTSGTITLSNFSVKEVQGNPAMMINQTSSDIENGSPYANIVQNGTFDTDSDWTKGTGWSIANGLASCDGSQSSSSLFYQNLGSLSGKTINISFTLSNYSAGHLTTAFFGASGTLDQQVSANGNYSFDIYIESGHNGNTGFTANSSFVGSIDNVTLQEVNTGLQGYWKMGDGTNDEYPVIYDQVDPTLGSEKVVDGNFPTPNNNWNLTFFTIANNKLHCISDGTYSNAYQSNVFTVGKTYKITFDITGHTLGEIRVRPSGQSPFFTANANGSYTFYYTATNSQIAIERNIAACNMFLENLSVKEVQGNPATMTNMVEGNITNQFPLTKIRNYYRMGDGILDGYPIIQDQTSPNLAHIPTTNLITYSEKIDDSSWTKNASSIVANQTTAPDNTLSADLLKEDSSNAEHWVRSLNITAVSGTRYSMSFYAKQKERTWVKVNFLNSGVVSYNAWVNLANGEVGTKNANLIITTSLQENGFYRIKVSADAVTTTINLLIGLATGDNVNAYQGDGTSGIYIWGCQVEEQSQATAYLKSDGIAAVRKSSTTNLLPYSEDFSQWTKTGATTISATNLTSPTGTTNATRITGLTGSGGNDLRIFPSNFDSANKDLTFSVYLKGSGTLRLQMSNGINQGIEKIVTLTSDWKRHQVFGDFNSTSSGNSFHCNIDDSSGATATTYDIWGSQLEQQTQAETYAKTTGLPVTIDLFTENNYGTMTNMSASDIVEDTP